MFMFMLENPKGRKEINEGKKKKRGEWARELCELLIKSVKKLKQNKQREQEQSGAAWFTAKRRDSSVCGWKKRSRRLFTLTAAAVAWCAPSELRNPLGLIPVSAP
jgi:hypothetical protein